MNFGKVLLALGVEDIWKPSWRRIRWWSTLAVCQLACIIASLLVIMEQNLALGILKKSPLQVSKSAPFPLRLSGLVRSWSGAQGRHQLAVLTFTITWPGNNATTSVDGRQAHRSNA